MSPFSLPLKHASKGALWSAAVALFATSTQAATNISQVYEIWTEVESNRETDNQSSGPTISSIQTLEYNSQQNGDIRSGATNMTFTDLGAGNFSYSSGNVSATATERPAGWSNDLNDVDRTTTPSVAPGPFGGADANVAGTISTVPEDPATKAKVNGGSSATFTITFELLPGEIKQANFELNYTLEIAQGDQNQALVEWKLVAPDMSTLGISGYDSRGDSNINVTSYLGGDTSPQTALLDQTGTYTLTMTAEVPLQDFLNAQKTASSTLDAVYFEVITVPEPSSTALLALSLSGCLFFRRRSRLRYDFILAQS